MATLSKHSVGGYRIRYNIFFPDGTKKLKAKYSNKQTIAKQIREDADFLEKLTRNNTVDHKYLKAVVSQGLITKAEALALSGGKDLSPVSWELLRQDYEIYSRTAHTKHHQATMRSRLNNLETFFQDIPITEIMVQDVLKWQSKRALERATKTVKEERDLLAKLLDFAIVREAIENNPARSPILKGTLKIDRSRVPLCLTYEEVKALVSTVKDSPYLEGRMELATLLFLFTGIRRGEACFLTRKDIREGEVLIQGKEVSKNETTAQDVKDVGFWRPKGNRPRVITIPPEIYPRIKKLLPKEDRFIFGGNHTYHLDTFSGSYDKVLKGINPELSLHCLRHTFVTWRIEHGLSGRGDNIVRVQQEAGHSDIQTTMGYTHIRVSPRKNILDLVRVVK